LIRVAIDAQHTRQTNAGGARYSNSLAKALAKRDDVTVIELGGGELVPRGTLQKKLLTARQEFLWYPWLGRRRAAAAGADVYHCPTIRGPLTRGKPPLVVTVHDLVPLRFPETMSVWNRFSSRATLRRVLDAADMLIASSQNTADDLNSLLKIPASRIRVVWIGVDDIFFAPPPPPVSKPKPFILFVGTPEPRKNLPRLIEAMKELRRRSFTHRLVIAGAGGWGDVQLEGDFVDRLGRVSDERLLSLYAQASCLAIPSIYEGFGLPAVEAMAAGTPVVVGAAGSLPEIVGNAGVLVDPYDTNAIASGIERAINQRDKLIAFGHARARQFNWSEAASKVASIYKEVV
jgi:glycosyltransferase involved in cell wall biosynthesis